MGEMLPTQVLQFPSEAAEDILASMGLPDPAALSSLATAFFDLPNGRLVKAGWRVSVAEAHAMEYIRHNTSIPVPEVFIAFEKDGVGYIVMEAVLGSTLQDAAFAMSQEQAHNIVVQLRGYILQLQNLPQSSSKGTMGQWPEGPYRNAHFLDPRPEREFADLAEFERYWMERVRDKFDRRAPVERPPGEARAVLAHGDFCPQNIMVDEGSGEVVAIIDWETFGWYPDFWDEMMLRRRSYVKTLQKAVTDVFGSLSLLGYYFYYLFDLWALGEDYWLLY